MSVQLRQRREAINLLPPEILRHTRSDTCMSIAVRPSLTWRLVQVLEERGLLPTAVNPEPCEIDRTDLACMLVLDAVCHDSLRIMPRAPAGGLRG